MRERNRPPNTYGFLNNNLNPKELDEPGVPKDLKDLNGLAICRGIDRNIFMGAGNGILIGDVGTGCG